jgi:hypothetical protein
MESIGKCQKDLIVVGIMSLALGYICSWHMGCNNGTAGTVLFVP